MPERKYKQYRVVKTDEVQGEGSYVKLKAMTNSELLRDLNVPDKKSNDKLLEFFGNILDKMIVDWNWVDDDGNPLPTPAENPGTVNSLPYQESQYLMAETGIQEMFSTKK